MESSYVGNTPWGTLTDYNFDFSSYPYLSHPSTPQNPNAITMSS